MKRVAILQSNYIPWKGYFDIVNRVDEFVLYDDVQYTRNDWRNRNRIKTATGLQWLTIPVRLENSRPRIRDVQAVDDSWRRRHWRALERNYGRAPCFRACAERFEALYAGGSETPLSQINRRFIEAVNDLLGIRTRLRWSWEFEVSGSRTERLVGICRQLGAGEYLSGPAARDLIFNMGTESPRYMLSFGGAGA